MTFKKLTFRPNLLPPFSAGLGDEGGISGETSFVKRSERRAKGLVFLDCESRVAFSSVALSSLSSSEQLRLGGITSGKQMFETK